MKERKKMLPKKVAPKGLYLYCKKHDRWFKHDNVVTCKNSCNLKYKAKIHIPGTKRAARVKAIHAETVEQAIQYFQQFKLDLKNNDFQKVELKPKVNKPIFIIDCIDSFISFKKGIDVPEHEKVELNSHHLRNLELCCEYITYALSDNKIDVRYFKFESINPTIVGYITSYIAKKIKANKTYNNYVANIQSFAHHIYTKYYPELNNPFKGLTKFLVKKDPKAISKTDFMKIVSVTTPDNGWGIEMRNGREVNVFLYRPWLIDAFYIGLFAGGRNEETVEMKWSDIKTNEEGQISLIEIIDRKVTRLKKKSGIENISYTKIVEVTPEFEKMLRELGYEEKKNTNEYILAPNEKMSRSTLKAFMSQAFTHFYSILNLPVKKNFKHLRKTYMTKCYIESNDTKDFLIKSGHANMDTPLNHYVDMKIVMEARRKKLYELKLAEEKNGADEKEKDKKEDRKDKKE